MQKIALTIILVVTLFSLNSFKTTTTDIETNQQINAILGDVSFFNAFATLPDHATGENLRIKTHLSYVEKLLRERDVSELPEQLQNNRSHLLDLLHEYHTGGSFPRNFDYEGERVPCFIDAEGRICAVGYLIEHTAGRAVAEQINAKHQYKKILDMDDPAVDEWIADSGLTKEECAMIQPQYGWQPQPVPPPNYNYISHKYGISTSILSGANLALSAVNSIQIGKGSNDFMAPVFGMMGGTSQIILGAVNFPNEIEPNESQKALSLVNIGLGTATVILSTWNLLDRKKPADKPTVWNIHNFQTPENKTGVAFSLSHRF